MEDKQLVVFEDDRFGAIRTITDDAGRPWFVAKDVAISLGYIDSTNAIKAHCKGVVKRSLPTAGGKQSINIIPESDLYRLIMNSKLPSAEDFQYWVFEEVLPAIRKTGKYETQGKKSNAIKAPSRSKVAQDLAANLKIAKIFGLEGNQAMLSANLMTSKQYPGVNLLVESEIELIVKDQEQYLTVSEIGHKNGGLSGYQVNRMLGSAGLQEETKDHKNRLVWVVTDEGKKHCQLLDTGKKHNGTPIMQIKWKADVLESCADKMVD
jgi:prophage antirepressor-like protein